MNRIIPAPFVPLVCQLVIGFGAHAAGTEQQSVSAVPAPESGPRNENGLVEEITVLGPARLPESRTSADGLTVQVIDAREIRASGARTFQEALQRIPGIHLADEQGNIRQEDLSLRGFSASPVTGVPQGISVFVDGVRVNEPAAEEVAFELIPLADIERIEIVRGPNAIFGRNTLGGAIHILTRRGGREPEASVQIEGGSWEYQEIRGLVSGPLGPLSGYLSLSEFSDQGWRVRGAGNGVRAFGKLGIGQEGASATLSYQFQVDRLQQPGSLPQTTLGTDRRENYTPGDFFDPALHFVTLNGRARLPSGLSVGVNGFFCSLDAEQFNASWISPDTRLFDRTVSAGGTLQLDHRACGRAAEPAQRRRGGHAQLRAPARPRRGESPLHDQRGRRAAPAPHLRPVRSSMGNGRIRAGTGADHRRTSHRAVSDGCAALRPDRPPDRRYLARRAGERDGKRHLLGMDPGRGPQLGLCAPLARFHLVDGGLPRACISQADLRGPCGSLRRSASRPRSGPDPDVSSSRPLSIARGGRPRVAIRRPHRPAHCIPRRSARRHPQPGRFPNQAGVLPARWRR